MSENNHPKRSFGNSRRDRDRRISPKCRRNLFGKMDDHEDFNREFEQLQKEEAKRFSETWNFDIETQAPLPGNYEWEVAGIASGSGLLALPSSLGTEGDSNPSEQLEHSQLSSYTESSLSQRSVTEYMEDDNNDDVLNENSMQQPSTIGSSITPTNYFSECSTRRKKLDEDDHDRRNNGSGKSSSSSTSTPKPPRM